MVESSTGKQIEKANMLLLSKEMNDKDRSMKTQLLINSGDSDEKLSGEKVWKENGYFNDIRPELNLVKVNMPENTLFYVNQGFIWTVKNGDLAMYIQNFILGQLIVAANQPEILMNIIVQKMKLNFFRVSMTLNLVISKVLD